MAKTGSSIQIRDVHRREYRRTMRRVLVGSIVLWFVLAIFLSDAIGGGIIVPLSIIMIIGLGIVRVSTWLRYRRDMQAELVGDNSPPLHDDVAAGAAQRTLDGDPASVAVAGTSLETPRAQGIPAGWFPDPWRNAAERYWDGTQWTGHMRG